MEMEKAMSTRAIPRHFYDTASLYAASILAEERDLRRDGAFSIRIIRDPAVATLRGLWKMADSTERVTIMLRVREALGRPADDTFTARIRAREIARPPWR